jgi:glycosyltransferase involved in cell wall biosynthesis
MKDVSTIAVEELRAGASPEGVPSESLATVSTLYLCYFGLREPLVQTQVLPYLRQLVRGGARLHLLTFEPEMRARWTAAAIAEERARLASEGIVWHARGYHKRPSLPATLYDVQAGARLAARLLRRGEVQVLHARGHVAALMAALAKQWAGGRMVFDIRGFMPEEYTDAGVWPEGGWLYRGVKRVERYLMASADAFVVLTERAREILWPGRRDTDERGRPVEVIPCCVDFRRFAAADAVSKEQLREELGLAGRRVLVYAGAFGGWYMTDEMLRFMALAHREDPRTYAMILTQSDAGVVSEKLRALGLGEGDFFVGRVAPSEVPRRLKAADIAVSFIRACYSKQSSSPTKLAEYLAAGLPVVCNAGVGDVDAAVEADLVGVILREFTDDAYGAALCAAEELRRDPGLAERCRRSARSRFDLDAVGGPGYRRLYERLLKSDK